MQLCNERHSLRRNKAKNRDWTIVISYVLFIYATLSIMPRIWNSFSRATGELSSFLVAVVFVILAMYVVFYLIAMKKTISSFLWLLFLIVFYVIALRMIELSIERIHFIEYGLLSIFVFKALRHSIQNKRIYAWAALIAFAFGCIDEGIQYFLPNRFFDVKDIAVNAVAILFGLALLALVFRPRLEL